MSKALRTNNRGPQLKINIRQARLLSDLKGIQFLNRGMADMVRFKQKRERVSDLDISLPEHGFNIDNLLDYFELSIRSAHSFSDFDWLRIKKMIKLHDIGEVGATEDVIAPDKSKTDSRNEINGLASIVARLPHALQKEVIELVVEKEKKETLAARLVHLLDKLDAAVSIATEGGVQEVKIVNASVGQIGNAFKTYVRQYNLGHIHLAREWGFPEIADFWEVVWARQIELGILEDENIPEEPVQLKFEFE